MTTIQYGGKSLNLTKSAELIAVRATRRGRTDLAATAARFGATPTRQMLGGFELLNVRNAGLPMEETLDTLRADEAIDVGTHVYHTSDDGVPFVPTGQIYIVFAKGTGKEEAQKLIEDHALEIIESRSDSELVARVTRQSQNPINVAAALQSSKIIAIAEPDFATPGALAVFVEPADALLANQWHLRNRGTLNGSSLGLKEGADARVIAAWKSAETLGSPNAIVAVIDDGFDLSHSDLSGAGKIIAPWDFTRNSGDPSPEFGADYPYFDAEHQEWVGDWHGTACAGVAIGAANGSGIVGAAPASRLMPVRWGPSLTDTQVVAWFDYATAQGASVVSCSWGAAASYFPLSTRKRAAITRCARDGRGGLGCVICFAAGNENTDIDDPGTGSLNGFATHPDVIAVSASTSMDQRSSYSSFGAAISVCGPSSGAGGRGILTTDVIGTFLRGGQVIESGYDAGAFTYSFGGTSSSTPLVAGICALLLSVKPTLTATEVRDLLQRTARKIGPAGAYDANGHSPHFGYGCVNAEAALQELLGAAPPNEGWTHELTQDEPWYDHPAQGRPPNGTINAYTLCVVNEDAGSFSRVQTKTGVRGYVATSSLRLLTS